MSPAELRTTSCNQLWGIAQGKEQKLHASFATCKWIFLSLSLTQIGYDIYVQFIVTM